MEHWILIIIGFLAIVFLSNIIQGITGFAGSIIAMPFIVLLVGLDTAKQVLNLLTILSDSKTGIKFVDDFVGRLYCYKNLSSYCME